MKLCPAAQRMYAEGLRVAAAAAASADHYESVGDTGRASGLRAQRDGGLRATSAKLERHRWRCSQCQ